MATALPVDPVTATDGPSSTDDSTSRVPESNQSQAFFSAFPAHVIFLPPPAADIPISVSNLSTVWRSKILNVGFDIQYSKTDGGNQQGRILILARGKNVLASYPVGTLADAGSPMLIAPKNGEYFSVSRFRQVKAELGPFQSTEQIQFVEVFLFNTSDQPIYYQMLDLSRMNGGPGPTPTNPASEPEPSS